MRLPNHYIGAPEVEDTYKLAEEKYEAMDDGDLLEKYAAYFESDIIDLIRSKREEIIEVERVKL